ncbi:MAG: hypothetical protein ACRBN8_17480 [Nannocystales bacterium]
MKLSKLIVAASLCTFGLSMPACDKKEEAKKEDKKDAKDGDKKEEEKKDGDKKEEEKK